MKLSILKEENLPEMQAISYFSAGTMTMSKVLRTICLAGLPLLQILHFVNNSSAQEITVIVDARQTTASTVQVRGAFTNARRGLRNLAFRRDVAGTEGLGERISQLRLMSADEKPVDVRQLIPGEYLSTADFTSWIYDFDLSPRMDPVSAAHVSWLSDEVGLLMLDDLLPLMSASRTSARIEFRLPSGWQIFSTERKTGDATFETADAQNAVFYVIRSGRPRQYTLRNSALKVFINGRWQFDDIVGGEVAEEIFDGYVRLFGSEPPAAANVYLLRFPQTGVKTATWEADTRGSSVTIVSSNMPFQTQAVQRLHEQLRHELFHLWIPNGLNLTGNYDWFYEGFALYVSLKTGVRDNRLRFEDYLDTLARAHTLDAMQVPKINLLQASEQRWKGANSRIYARGMLVAFLCDLALLQNSKGKMSVYDLVRELFSKHRSGSPVRNANDSIFELLKARRELADIISNYIDGSENIEWKADLLAAGIEAKEENFVSQLIPVNRPTSRQRLILDKLGYNNWRKLSPRSK